MVSRELTESANPRERSSTRLVRTFKPSITITLCDNNGETVMRKLPASCRLLRKIGRSLNAEREKQSLTG